MDSNLPFQSSTVLGYHFLVPTEKRKTAKIHLKTGVYIKRQAVKECSEVNAKFKR